MNTPAHPHFRFRPFLPLPFGLALGLLAGTPVISGATSAAPTGTVEGRVFNAATGAALVNARIMLADTARETVTDETGSFRLVGVPAGEAEVRVLYLGLDGQSVRLQVPAGAVASREFNLARAATVPASATDVVKMSKFTVVEDSLMTAQALAMNEQRVAPSIKNVVAFDEFGDRGYENLGEFLLFLPGVVANVDGDSGPDGVSLRGMPQSYSGITLDGGALAGARANTRAIDPSEVPMANLSRIEITKVPTPDLPASGLGGSINLITSGGFQHKRPTLSYNASTFFHNGNGYTFDWPRHHRAENSPKFTLPSADFTYFQPINQRLAIHVGGAYTWRVKPLDNSESQRDETPTWNLVNLFQRAASWASRTQQYTTISGQAGVDWQITPLDRLSADVYVKNYSMIVTRSNFDVNYGTGATGNANFTQGGAVGDGQVNQGNGTWYEHKSATDQLNLNYRHKGPRWTIGAVGSWSRSDYGMHDIEEGYFTTAPARISNLILRGEDNSPDGIARRITAVTRGGVPVDVYDGRNYSVISGTSTSQHGITDKMGGRFDVGRDFDTTVRFALKTGVAFDQMSRERRGFSRTYNFAPNGNTSEAARLAGNFDVFDERYLAEAKTMHGNRYRSISQQKVYELFRQHPDWFVLDQAGAYQNTVTSSREFTESVSAAYLRSDVRLFRNRLWLVGGARFERTEVEGSGPLDNISAQFQRDANGDFILSPTRAKIPVSTDALVLRKLRYTERGAHGSSKYDGLYPSLNGTFNLSDHLLVRAAYARTIGRPEVTFVTPGTTITDPDVASPTITVSNVGLRPWTADNYDLSLETYDFKGGFGQVGIFQKNVKNFFGAVRTPVTPELLEFHGLPDDGSLNHYEFVTRENAGDAKITGLELSYRQTLNFLPQWARGFQVFFNYTKLNLSGSATADFTDFNPEKYSGGINFVRSRLTIKTTYSHQAESVLGSVAVSAANGIPANTNTYRKSYDRLSVYAQYSFSRRLTFYGTVKDLGGLTIHDLRYTPGTPDYAKGARLQKLGYILTLGVKGTF